MFKMLSSFERIIFSISPKRLYVTLWLIQLVKTGVWFFPYIGQNVSYPFDMPVHAGYRFTNWFAWFLAWCLNIKTIPLLIGLFFIFALGFSWIVYKLITRYLSDDSARVAIIIFFLLPVSGTVYYWLDFDAITLFLMALIIYRMDSWHVALFSGIVLGLNHFQQSMVAFGALLFAMILARELFKKQALCVLLGVLLGKLGLMLLFHFRHIEISYDRFYWMLRHLPRLFYEFLYSIHPILWSVLGLAWIVAIIYAEQGRKTLPFFLTLLGLIGIVPFIEDETRVIAIISFPLLTVFWLKNEQFLKKLPKQLMALLCLIWVFLPWAWVWQSGVRSSMFPYDVVFVLHKTFGWFTVPPNNSGNALGEWAVLPSKSSMAIPLRRV